MFRMSLFFAAIGAYQPLAAHEYRSSYTVVTPTRPSIVETANFRIYGISRLSNAQAIGQHFETLRSSLARTWFDQRRLVDWSPKCQVVVHATLASYTRAVGQNQFATVGSSRVDASRDSITSRRLDIRADQAGWFAAAVPHELTHLIMADEFLGRELPCWADEGMAVLADTAAKQSLHRRDLELGHRSGKVCRLEHFVCQRSYPAASEITAFYGQSAALVKYLVQCRSPAEFVRFLHLAEKHGYDAALAEVYSLPGIHSLEREWLNAPKTSNALAATALDDRFSAMTSLVAISTTPY